MKKITLFCTAVAAALGMNAQETTPLTIDMWHQWEGMNEETKVWGPDATIVENPTVQFVTYVGSETPDNFVMGDVACNGNCYADISAYGGIEGKGQSTNGVVRFWFNRKDLQGEGIEYVAEFAEDGTFKFDFSQLPGKPEFYHLNFVKFHWGQEGTVEYINLLPKSDEPEIPADPYAITAAWFHQWDGYGADAAIIAETAEGIADQLGKEVGEGATVLGTGSVWGDIYTDLTSYEGIEAEGTPGVTLRLLFNRPTKDAGITECRPAFDADGKFTFMFTDVKDGDVPASFIHLNAVKIDWGMPEGVSTCKVTKFNAIPKGGSSAVNAIEKADSSVIYNIYGQRVDETYRGIVIKNGKKYIQK